MKNTQKGFTVPLLVIAAVLLLGGGIYFYNKNIDHKKEIQVSVENLASSTKKVLVPTNGSLTDTSAAQSSGNYDATNLATTSAYAHYFSLNYNGTSQGNVWEAALVNISSPVNSISFNAVFNDQFKAQGFLTVYWDGKPVSPSIDERDIILNEITNYTLNLPQTYSSGTYTLSFRLDSFTEVPSSVSIGSISLGYADKDKLQTSTKVQDIEWNKLIGLTTSENSFGIMKIQDGLKSVLTKLDCSHYAKYFTKGNEVYFIGFKMKPILVKVVGADGATFMCENGMYAKDMYSVYMRENKIVGADPNSFQSYLSNDYNDYFSKDNNFVYYGATKTFLDPVTFEVVDGGSDKDCGYGPYVKDKNGIYEFVYSYSEKISKLTKIEGVDVASFGIIGQGYSRDKNHVYSNAIVVPSVDPKTFKPVCNVG